MTQNKKLLVSAIKNGTVIDHISVGHALKIIRLLDLPAEKKIVTVGLNLPSKISGKKDIIKVEGRELTSAEVNEVAILAPTATINIIKKYEIIKKFKVEIPTKIEHVIVCPNPKCITNNEKMNSLFQVEKLVDTIKLTCHYCERSYRQEDIREYNT